MPWYSITTELSSPESMPMAVLASPHVEPGYLGPERHNTQINEAAAVTAPMEACGRTTTCVSSSSIEPANDNRTGRRALHS